MHRNCPNYYTSFFSGTPQKAHVKEFTSAFVNKNYYYNDKCQRSGFSQPDFGWNDGDTITMDDFLEYAEYFKVLGLEFLDCSSATTETFDFFGDTETCDSLTGSTCKVAKYWLIIKSKIKWMFI